MPSQFFWKYTFNESLVYINTLLPMFKKKYDIEKLTLLRDGSGNYHRGNIMKFNERRDCMRQNVYEMGKTKFVARGNITEKLLSYIKDKYDANVMVSISSKEF